MPHIERRGRKEETNINGDLRNKSQKTPTYTPLELRRTSKRFARGSSFDCGRFEVSKDFLNLRELELLLMIFAKESSEIKPQLLASLDTVSA